MHRMSARGRQVLPAFVLLVSIGQLAAAPPAAEKLFPTKTTEFVSIKDPTRLGATWHQTQLAQLLNDPATKPFLDELSQHTTGFNHLMSEIGIDFELVKQAAGGEVAWAVILANPNQVAHAMTIDVSDRGQGQGGVRNLWEQMGKKLVAKNGRFNQQNLPGNNVNTVAFTLPNGHQIVYGVKDSLLLISDDFVTFQEMANRLTNQDGNCLAGVPAYQQVKAKTQPMPGEQPMLQFYFEPIARTEAQMIYTPALKKVKRDNIAEALRKEGIDGIKGVGAALSFQDNGTDMLLRAFAYAPPPFHGALRMAKLPNEAPLNPDPWVPADLSAYVTFGLDMVNLYDSFDTLFERLADEKPGTFKKIMESLQKDDDGPHVDVREEIMAQLQNRVTLINDATRPIAEKSERFLLAIPVKNQDSEQILANALRKCFETDRRIKGREFNGVQLWEYHAKTKKTGANGKNESISVPSTTFGVTKGHLFIATQASLLEKVLTQNGPTLSQAQDFQHMNQELVRLGMGVSSARSFVRFDVGMEATYVMLRANKLDKVQSVYAALLWKMLKADEGGKVMRADGSKLPPYQQISHYMGVGGVYSQTEPDGWKVVATVLTR